MFCKLPVDPHAIPDIFFVHLKNRVENDCCCCCCCSCCWRRELTPERLRLPLRLREPLPLVDEYSRSLMVKPFRKHTKTAVCALLAQLFDRSLMKVSTLLQFYSTIEWNMMGSSYRSELSLALFFALFKAAIQCVRVIMVCFPSGDNLM